MQAHLSVQEKWNALPEWVRKLVGKHRNEWDELPDSVRNYFSSGSGLERLDRAFIEYTKDVDGEFR